MFIKYYAYNIVARKMYNTKLKPKLIFQSVTALAQLTLSLWINTLSFLPEYDSPSRLAPLIFWRRNIFLILAHSVYKMWIIQEPNTLELWNKIAFWREKNGEYTPCLKYSVHIFVE